MASSEDVVDPVGDVVDDVEAVSLRTVLDVKSPTDQVL